MSSVVMLYHGSSSVVAHPEAARNAGFSDLGRGFYLTDDREAAAGRADLVVQYCFRDQRLIDDHLVFRGDVSSRSLVS